jgi:hypothetical protein
MPCIICSFFLVFSVTRLSETRRGHMLSGKNYKGAKFYRDGIDDFGMLTHYA